jgi:hypothetical protein
VLVPLGAYAWMLWRDRQPAAPLAAPPLA